MLQWVKDYITNNEKNLVFDDSPYSVEDNVAILNVDTTLGAITINLQEIVIEYNRDYRLVIVDSGNASVNNITINASGSDLINNLPSLVISNNGDKVVIDIIDVNNYSAIIY